MKLKLVVCDDAAKGNALSKQQFKAEIDRAAQLWKSGKIGEATSLFIDLFDASDPTDWCSVMPFFEKFEELGAEYQNLIGKLLVLRLLDADGKKELDDLAYTWKHFAADMDDLPVKRRGNIAANFGELAAKTVGGAWSELIEEFYEKCPGCMFMGDAEEPFSLKLRSESRIECIPETESGLSGMKYMDGYAPFEGWALVKDVPAVEGSDPEKYPAPIRKLLKELAKRDMKYFPNIIFPLTAGENISDTCRQMKDLLQLLDHGYHFQDIRRYMAENPKFFADEIRGMLVGDDDEGFKEDNEEEDDELVFDLDDEDFKDDDEDGDDELVFDLDDEDFKDDDDGKGKDGRDD